MNELRELLYLKLHSDLAYINQVSKLTAGKNYQGTESLPLRGSSQIYEDKSVNLLAENKYCEFGKWGVKISFLKALSCYTGAGPKTEHPGLVWKCFMIPCLKYFPNIWQFNALDIFSTRIYT